MNVHDQKSQCRPIHAALARTINADGTEQAKRILEAFEELNATLFAGMLGIPFVLLAPPSSPRAHADYSWKDPHGIESVIRIRPSLLEKKGPEFVMDVLLHEMVHAWVAECADLSESQKKTERTYKGHGPAFANRCNEIGAKLGLDEVSTKGRGGKPDCSAWPMCVRPDGFYPDHAKNGSAKKSSKKTSIKASCKKGLTVISPETVLLMTFEAIAECLGTERAQQAMDVVFKETDCSLSLGGTKHVRRQ